MISYRHADILEKALKHRVYDVFFYIWIPTDNAVGDTQYPVKNMHGLFYAYLEIYFPNNLTKRDEQNNVAAKIKNKIEVAIGQPIKQNIVAQRNEDLSNFFTRITKDLKSKLADVGEKPMESESVNHGLRIHLKMKAL